MLAVGDGDMGACVPSSTERLDSRIRGNDGPEDEWRRERSFAEGYSANIDLLRKTTPQISTYCGGRGLATAAEFVTRIILLANAPERDCLSLPGRRLPGRLTLSAERSRYAGRRVARGTICGSAVSVSEPLFLDPRMDLSVRIFPICFVVVSSTVQRS